MKKLFKQNKNSNKGFTLVEVLVSIILLALIAIAFMPIFSTYLKNIIKAGELTKDRYHSISTIMKLVGSETNSFGYYTSTGNMKLTLNNYDKTKKISTKSAEGNGSLKRIEGHNILGDPGRPAQTLVSFKADNIETFLGIFPSTITDDFITKDIRIYSKDMQLNDPNGLNVYYTDTDGTIQKLDSKWYDVKASNSIYGGSDTYRLVVTLYGGGPISFSTSPLYFGYHDHDIEQVGGKNPGKALKVEVTAPQTIMVGDKNKDGKYYYYATSQDDTNGDGNIDIVAKEMDPLGKNPNINLKSAMNDVKWISKTSGDGLNTNKANTDSYGYFIMGGDLGQIRRFWRDENGNYFWGGDYSDSYEFDHNLGETPGSQSGKAPSDTLAVKSHNDNIASSRAAAQSAEYMQVKPYSYSYISAPYSQDGRLLKNGMPISDNGKNDLYINTMFTINALKNRDLNFYTTGNINYDMSSNVYRPSELSKTDGFGVHTVNANKINFDTEIDRKYTNAENNIQKYIRITSVDTVSVQPATLHNNNNSLNKSYNLYLGYIPAVLDIWDNGYTDDKTEQNPLSGLKKFNVNEPDQNGFRTVTPWRATLGIGTTKNFNTSAHFSYGTTIFDQTVFSPDVYIKAEKYEFYNKLKNSIQTLYDDINQKGNHKGIEIGKNDSDFEKVLKPFLNYDTNNDGTIDRLDDALDFDKSSLGLSEIYRKYHTYGYSFVPNIKGKCEVFDDVYDKAKFGHSLPNSLPRDYWGFRWEWILEYPNDECSSQFLEYKNQLDKIYQQCIEEIAKSEEGYNKYKQAIKNSQNSLKIAWTYGNTTASDYRLTGMCGPTNFDDMDSKFDTNDAQTNNTTIEALKTGEDGAARDRIKKEAENMRAEAKKKRELAAKNLKENEDFKAGKIKENDARKKAARAKALDDFERETGYRLEKYNGNFEPSANYGNSAIYNTTVKAIFELAIANAEKKHAEDMQKENDNYDELVNVKIVDDFNQACKDATEKHNKAYADADNTYANKLDENTKILNDTLSEEKDYMHYYQKKKDAYQAATNVHNQKNIEIEQKLQADIAAENERYQNAISPEGLQALLDTYNSEKSKYQANHDFYNANHEYYENLLSKIDAGVSVHSKTKTSPDENLSDEDEIKIDDAHNVDGKGKDLGLKQYFEENHKNIDVCKDEDLDDIWDHGGFFQGYAYIKTSVYTWKSCDKLEMSNENVIKEHRQAKSKWHTEKIGFKENTNACPDMKTYRDMIQNTLNEIKSEYDAYEKNEQSSVKSPADFEDAKKALENEHKKILDKLQQEANDLKEQAVTEHKNANLAADNQLDADKTQAQKDKVTADENALKSKEDSKKSADETKSKELKDAEDTKTQALAQAALNHNMAQKIINKELSDAKTAAENERKNSYDAAKKKYKDNCKKYDDEHETTQLEINAYFEKKKKEASWLIREAELLEQQADKISSGLLPETLYDKDLATKLTQGYHYGPLNEPVGQKYIQKQNSSEVSVAYMSIPGAFGNLENTSTTHNQQVTETDSTSVGQGPKWNKNYNSYQRNDVYQFNINRTTTFLDSDSITVNEGTPDQKTFSLAVGYVLSGISYKQKANNINYTTVPTIMNTGVVYIRSGDKEKSPDNKNPDRPLNFVYGTGYELQIEENTFHEFYSSNTYAMEPALMQKGGKSYNTKDSIDQFASAGYWRDILHPLYYSIFGERFTPDVQNGKSYWPYYYAPENSYITGHILYDKKINCVKWGKTWAGGHSAMWGASDGTLMSWGENYYRYMDGTHREAHANKTDQDAKYGSGAVMAEFQNWKRVHDAFNRSYPILRENSETYYDRLKGTEYQYSTHIPISWNFASASIRKLYTIPRTWKQMCEFATKGSLYTDPLHTNASGSSSPLIENSYLDKCSLDLDRHTNKSCEDYGFVSPLNSITGIENNGMNTWVAVGTQAYHENKMGKSNDETYLDDPLNMKDSKKHYASKNNKTINNGNSMNYKGSYVNVRSWIDLSNGKDYGPNKDEKAGTNNFFFRWQAVKFTNTKGVNIVGVTYANDIWFIMGYIDKDGDGKQSEGDLGVAYYTNDPTKSCDEQGGWKMVKTTGQKSKDHTEAAIIHGKNKVTPKEIAAINALATQK